MCHYAACFFCLMAMAFGIPFSAFSAPFVPSQDDTVLERLPTTIQSGSVGALRRLRQRLATDSDNLDLAVQTARQYLDLAREASDPRYIGYAQAALAPWWADSHPPLSVLVLRATIRQHLHDFESALADLDDVLTRDPRQAQARLTRATVYRVIGRYPEAKRDCLRLLPVASELVAVTCATELASLTGQGDHAYALLEQTWQRSGESPTTERLWALTALAEMASRIGKLDLAERHYRNAMRLDQRDGYLLGSFADFLLDQGRPGEVVTLLSGKEGADALLLRLTLAERRLHRPEASVHVSLLAARFDAARLRGDVVHRREEARFALECLGQPQRALKLAQANWAVQREPADVRILLESAIAFGHRTAAESALTWMRDHHVTDRQLQRLAAELS